MDSIDALEGSAKLDALMARVTEQQRAFRSLSADFVQIKQSELLLEAVESKGEFLFRAPDKVRWDYGEPDRNGGGLFRRHGDDLSPRAGAG